MDHDEIKRLIDLLQDTDVTELQIEREGHKLKIKREKFFYPIEPSTQPPSAKAPPDESTEATAAQPEEKGMTTITSPIVGIFHRAPAPESPPYVEVGAAVKKGQVLCIVEAMKLMNEIECDTDGIVSKILVENGQPVEYGQPLFLIESAL